MKISSSAFPNGKPIPSKYAQLGVTGGENLSIPLSWSDRPSNTVSFALTIVDPHPVAKNWFHWGVVNIPPSVTSLPEGASGKSLPQGAKELYNSYGSPGYGGPQPPKGSGQHPYVITIYALNSNLDL